jgi:hypothetical protein
MNETTYAVKWREPDGKTYLGRLELGAEALVLEGRTNGDGPVLRSIGYGELRGLHIGRGPDELLDGLPALVVERAAGDVVVGTAVVHLGVLQELADRLAAVRAASPRCATLVVPLREGALERARELTRRGPPFDPAETSLTRHQVLLTESEAIFVFEAGSEVDLDELLGRTAVWAAATAWRDLVAGPPRLAEASYAWERPAAPAHIGLGF